MRVKKKQDANNKTLRMAFVFIALVLSLIVGSYASKIFQIAKESLFDGSHRLTVLFEHTVISFAPWEKSISVLEVEMVEKVNYQTLSVMLGLPIDGFVISSHPFEPVKESRQVLSLLWRGFIKQDSLETNLTTFDFARLWLFTRFTPSYQFVKKDYRVISLDDVLSDTQLDKLMASLFLDVALSEEKVSIYIVNASGVTGLGNRIARLLTNVGGNVVAVSTGDSMLPVSEISAANMDTYTLKKIRRLLPYKVTMLNKKTIADIVITLGKDKSGLFSL
ncbi:MAG: LytR C-terminal domain-containing protein [Candidatus Levybacteria bacterium]|nr:LytR C-terminal domain-containing protein [Candidatus Levybacteria bacterium]